AEPISSIYDLKHSMPGLYSISENSVLYAANITLLENGAEVTQTTDELTTWFTNFPSPSNIRVWYGWAGNDQDFAGGKVYDPTWDFGGGPVTQLGFTSNTDFSIVIYDQDKNTGCVIDPNSVIIDSGVYVDNSNLMEEQHNDIAGLQEFKENEWNGSTTQKLYKDSNFQIVYSPYVAYTGAFYFDKTTDMKLNDNITRAEMAQVVLNILTKHFAHPGVFDKKLDISGFQAQAATFSDVKPEDWFYDAVSLCSGLKIMNGTGNGKFDPNGKVTYEEAYQIFFNLDKSFGIRRATPSSDGDVWLSENGWQPPTWSRNAVLYMDAYLASQHNIDYPYEAYYYADLTQWNLREPCLRGAIMNMVEDLY
ncbi:MAG: S-layer homology domain-containing protein, partial [Butyricicoccus sp.]|nr:S-layer homology domain-containing protein [Butyricicoccus sp.]